MCHKPPLDVPLLQHSLFFCPFFAALFFLPPSRSWIFYDQLEKKTTPINTWCTLFLPAQFDLHLRGRKFHSCYYRKWFWMQGEWKFFPAFTIPMISSTSRDFDKSYVLCPDMCNAISLYLPLKALANTYLWTRTNHLR